MASNLNVLKKHITLNLPRTKLISLARKEAFKGNIQKAVDLYHEAAFDAIKTSMIPNERTKEIANIVKSINEIGGVASEQLLDYMEDHSNSKFFSLKNI